MRSLAIALLLLAPATALADKDFHDAAGASYDCAEDPVVNINNGTGTFALTGACTEVNVNGTKLTVTIAAAGTVNLNGSSNVVTVAELGAININGTKNKVTWKKAQTGKKPTVLVNGKGNAVAKAK